MESEAPLAHNEAEASFYNFEILIWRLRVKGGEIIKGKYGFSVCVVILIWR